MDCQALLVCLLDLNFDNVHQETKVKESVIPRTADVSSVNKCFLIVVGL